MNNSSDTQFFLPNKSTRDLWNDRAQYAAKSVNTLFARPLPFFKNSWVGQPFSFPERGQSSENSSTLDSFRANGRWDYWWNAHYLDNILDAACRKIHMNDNPLPELDQAQKLLKGIWIRNGLKFSNSFYDDMAWLILAVQRLEKLQTTIEAQERSENFSPAQLKKNKKSLKRIKKCLKSLDKQLQKASTNHLKGGVFWNKTHDFKNVPATAPTAIYKARAGHRDEAHDLLEWIKQYLTSPEYLILDGMKGSKTSDKRRNKLWPVTWLMERYNPQKVALVEQEPQIISNIYSYNQGTYLGALLAHGSPENLAKAEELIDAIDQHLAEDSVVKTYGNLDGGLFTGILIRYLALAARDQRLDYSHRKKAAEMVYKTAENLWNSQRRLARSEGSSVFSQNTHEPATKAYGKGARIDLTTQLQAWMIFESAFSLATATHF